MTYMLAARCDSKTFEQITGLRAAAGFVALDNNCVGLYPAAMLEDLEFILERAGVTYRKASADTYKDGVAKLNLI